MEAGITAEDQNFYTRSPPRPSSAHRRQPSLDPDAPEVPPKIPLFATNLPAVITNSGVNGYAEDSPDRFYRDFRPDESSADAEIDVMSTANGTPRSQQSLRSNGNGSTTRYPPLSTSRSVLKPLSTGRSVSAPVDGKAAAPARSMPVLNNANKPSVKDLTRRFDQGNSQPPSPVIRKAPTRATPGGNVPTSFGHLRTRTAVEETPPALAPKAGEATRVTQPSKVGQTRGSTSRNTSPTETRTQRGRFAQGDQRSNNTLSSQVRAERPRNTLAAKENLSPTASRHPPLPPAVVPSAAPTPPQVGRSKPLFGEIVPPAIGTAPVIGYGISTLHTRSTSDSSLQPPLWTPIGVQLQDEVIRPSAPLESVDSHQPIRSPRHHTRAHSDMSGSKVNSKPAIKQREAVDQSSSPNSPTLRPSRQDNSAKGIQSRIPLSAGRRNNSSNVSPASSISPPSTRSTSPGTGRSDARSDAQRSRRTVDQPPRSAASRASTPSGRSSPRQSVRSAGTGNTAPTLNAYISASTPKLSPSLRSSRPRQPVSTASTVIPKGKVIERALSPRKSSAVKITRVGSSTELRSRKASEAQVDFAARRARIRQGYTKSIQQSGNGGSHSGHVTKNDSTAAAVGAKRLDSPQTSPLTKPLDSGLTIDTALLSPPRLAINTYTDSPTLGMPGAFPETSEQDELPQSAISDVTAITDIENEPQTEEPYSAVSDITAVTDIENEPEPEEPRNIESLPGSSNPATIEAAVNEYQNDIHGSINIILDTEETTPIPTGPARSTIASNPPEPVLEVQPENQATNSNIETSNEVPESSDIAKSQSTLSPSTSRILTVIEEHIIEPIPKISLDEGMRSTVQYNVNYEDIFRPNDSEDELDDLQTRSAVDIKALSPKLASLATSLLPASDDLSQQCDTPVTEIEDNDILDSSENINSVSRSSTTIQRPIQDARTTSSRSTWAEASANHDSEYLKNYLYGSTESQGPPPPPPPPKVRTSFPKPEVPPKPEQYSPQTSPRGPRDTLRQSSHLIGLSHGLGLTAQYTQAQSNMATLPSLHDHNSSMPSAPEKSSDNLLNIRSPPLANYNRFQPTPSLRRTSDEVYSPRPSLSTPRSSTQNSTDGDSTTLQSQHTASPQLLAQESEEEKRSAEKLSKQLFMRRMVIHELIDTEALYLKDMHVVEEIYKGTAEACPRLDARETKTIFRNIDQVVAFSTLFLAELKSAAGSVYVPRRSRQNKSSGASMHTVGEDRMSVAPTITEDTEEQKHQRTCIGARVGAQLKQMETVYTDFLKNSELASSRLDTLESDPAVAVWLEQCSLAAKDLTAAWSLDALLVKPVQRITRYQLLLNQLLSHTSADHPDHDALQSTCRAVVDLLKNIDELKKRIQTVGKIVGGRKRKESDVRSNIAKAFRRGEKSVIRGQDDEAYVKVHEKYSDAYLHLQVVLRDVEYYTRQTESWVNDFLRYLSAMELNMRHSASPYPELESKWSHFNMSMREMGNKALVDHVSHKYS
jgi:hypothetical protein